MVVSTERHDPQVRLGGGDDRWRRRLGESAQESEDLVLIRSGRAARLGGFEGGEECGGEGLGIGPTVAFGRESACQRIHPFRLLGQH
ncbi:hypothetical protein G3I24_35515, partial [Micromonospora aurantiaca]|nr:hypothetical protein [Micromonospora aurantiaca]